MVPLAKLEIILDDFCVTADQKLYLVSSVCFSCLPLQFFMNFYNPILRRLPFQQQISWRNYSSQYVFITISSSQIGYHYELFVGLWNSYCLCFYMYVCKIVHEYVYMIMIMICVFLWQYWMTVAQNNYISVYVVLC